MIKISLVGDIGSGKTYVSKLFGAPCFFADTEVKRLYRSNEVGVFPVPPTYKFPTHKVFISGNFFLGTKLEMILFILTNIVKG